MNKNFSSLEKDVESNKIRVENIKSILIDEFVKKNITLCSEFEPFIENFEYKYLGDICALTYDEVKALYVKYYKGEYTCNRFLYELKNTMHFNGLIFKDEYVDVLSISDDLACIRLEDISDFPSKLYRVFYRTGIYTLGDLLLTNYNDIIKTDSYSSKIKGLGNKSIKKIIEYVHSIGFLFVDEDKSADYILAKCREDGIAIVSDIIHDTFLCNVLYDNKIYTVEDLKNIGFDVLELPGVGPSKKELLKEIISDLEVFVDEDYEFTELCGSIEELLVKLNDFVKMDAKKIIRKNKLLDEYNSILEEMNQNRERERELDMEISNKIDEYYKVYKK